MKIAINNRKNGFHKRWINYCQKNNISYKIVDCYSNDVIEHINDCDVLFWHYNHLNAKDELFAKQLLFSLEQSGLQVFPDFKTGWYFDDKVGQKYLLDAINAPLVPTYVFYTKQEALHWLNNTSFPKVFKLRGGAGSSNVKLALNKKEAKILVKRAFSKGFKYYDAYGSLKERIRMFSEKKTDIKDVLKGFIRLFKEPEFSKLRGREIGYAYFQDFIPNNTFDIRVIVIGQKAFAVKRFVRKNDFRASGSGMKDYSKESIDIRTVKIAFEVAKKLQTQCVGIDFVFDQDKNPLIVEIGYGFAIEFYDPCPGYWDAKLNWHKGHFIPQEWMIEDLLETIK